MPKTYTVMNRWTGNCTAWPASRWTYKRVGEIHVFTRVGDPFQKTFLDAVNYIVTES